MEIRRFTRRESLEKARYDWLHYYHWATQEADGGQANESWKAANIGANGWIKLDFVDTEWFYHQLLALPDTAGEEDIVRLIGDHNFARSFLKSLMCNECGQKVETLILFNTCLDEGGTGLCSDCLSRGVQLLKGMNNEFCNICIFSFRSVPIWICAIRRPVHDWQAEMQ